MKRTLIIEMSKEELESCIKELLDCECSKFGDKQCNCVLSGKRRPNECFGCKNEHKEIICKCLHQIIVDENVTSDSCIGCIYENYDAERFKDPIIVIKEWFGYSLKDDVEPQFDDERQFDEIILTLIK